MTKSKSGSVLEKLRNSKKEAKQQQQQYASSLKDGTFILPAFKAVPPLADTQTISSSGGMDDHGEETSGSQ